MQLKYIYIYICKIYKKNLIHLRYIMDGDTEYLKNQLSLLIMIIRLHFLFLSISLALSYTTL